MTMTKPKAALSLLCNFAVIAQMCFYVRHYLLDRAGGKLYWVNLDRLRYFTTDSNLLAALCCLPMLIWAAAVLLGVKRPVPRAVQTLKHIGTTAVTVTMLTVLFFLGPTQGYAVMLSGDMLYMHLLCPLLSILSLVLCEGEGLTRRSCLLSDLPVLLYGGLYLYMVIVRGPSYGGWPDFYGFNFGGDPYMPGFQKGGYWFISLPMMLLAGWGIACGLRALSRCLAPKKEPSDAV